MFSQTLTLPNATTLTFPVVDPFGNTKEIVLLNLDNTNAIYVKTVNAKTAQAQIAVFFPTGSVAAGDVITAPGPITMTGFAGARTPGANNFNATLTGAALATEVAAAINDGANAWNGNWSATADVTTGGVHFVRLTVDTSVNVGAASNGYGPVAVTVATAGDMVVSPGDVTTNSTTGGYGAAPVAGDVTEATSFVLPKESSATFFIGSEVSNGDSGFRLVFLPAAGTNVKINVTYVQNNGGGGKTP
jgi:hypothetical protein